MGFWVFDVGAMGLVLANGFNLGMCLLWSWASVRGYLRGQGVELDVRGVLPSSGTVAVGFLAASYLGISSDIQGNFLDIVKTGAVGGLYGVLL